MMLNTRPRAAFTLFRRLLFWAGMIALTLNCVVASFIISAIVFDR